MQPNSPSSTRHTFRCSIFMYLPVGRGIGDQTSLPARYRLRDLSRSPTFRLAVTTSNSWLHLGIAASLPARPFAAMRSGKLRDGPSSVRRAAIALTSRVTFPRIDVRGYG